VREGERVEAGQHLMSLEYYKIVTEIVAPTAGIVQHLHVTLEAEVQPGELLIELAPLPS
jgi:biotin carboxyl carrier protein